MKVEIDIPDFIPPQRIIHIMAGMEQIGYITPHERKKYKKIERCTGCGACCNKIDCPNRTELDGGKCLLGLEIPYICVTSEPYMARSKKMEGCTSRYEEY